MDVKICNLTDPDFNYQFIDSLVNTGFAVITHHGISEELIRKVQWEWRTFFKGSEGYKNRYINSTDSNMGYGARLTETAVGSNKADLKEFFHLKPNSSMPPEASRSTKKLYELLQNDVAAKLLKAIQGLGSNLNYEEVCQNSDNTLMRVLYYPPLSEFEATDAVRAAAHEDINFITLLVAASASGLQVQDNEGQWHNVPHLDNSIVVNVGDQLQLASRGFLKSTTHRVVNPPDSTSDRISIPLFIHPRGETLLAPDVTAQSFLNERLNNIYKGGYSK